MLHVSKLQFSSRIINHLRKSTGYLTSSKLLERSSRVCGLRIATLQPLCTVSKPVQQVQYAPDRLYDTIHLEVRGNEQAVLESYVQYVSMAAKELDIHIERVWKLEPKPYKWEMYTLLRSVFVQKEHRVQYEIRTYYKFIQLNHLTGSTADTFLEYIQRNLPEGVAMKVTQTEIQRLPENLKPVS